MIPLWGMSANTGKPPSTTNEFLRIQSMRKTTDPETKLDDALWHVIEAAQECSAEQLEREFKHFAGTFKKWAATSANALRKIDTIRHTRDTLVSLADEAISLLAKGEEPTLPATETATAYQGALSAGNFELSKRLTDATLSGRPINVTW